jgi:hypothetical protein
VKGERELTNLKKKSVERMRMRMKGWMLYLVEEISVLCCNIANSQLVPPFSKDSIVRSYYCHYYCILLYVYFLPFSIAYSLTTLISSKFLFILFNDDDILCTHWGVWIVWIVHVFFIQQLRIIYFHTI